MSCVGVSPNRHRAVTKAVAALPTVEPLSGSHGKISEAIGTAHAYTAIRVTRAVVSGIRRDPTTRNTIQSPPTAAMIRTWPNSVSSLARNSRPSPRATGNRAHADFEPAATRCSYRLITSAISTHVTTTSVQSPVNPTRIKTARHRLEYRL